MSTSDLTTDLPPDTKWENGKLEQQPRELPATATTEKPFAVELINKTTRVPVWAGRVRAECLKDAEERAIAKVAYETKGDPRQLEAIRVHELCPLCGSKKGDDREA